MQKQILIEVEEKKNPDKICLKQKLINVYFLVFVMGWGGSRVNAIKFQGVCYENVGAIPMRAHGKEPWASQFTPCGAFFDYFFF